MNPADYSVIERLRDGRPLQIRAQRPSDRALMQESLARASAETMYRRFFAPRKSFSEREVDFFLNIDFVGHVALVAVLEEGDRQIIAGGGRYIVARPGCAEVAFAVDDPHQGLGIGTRLLRHLIAIARDAGLEELVAEVLEENGPMLKVFQRCGLGMTTRRGGGVVRVMLDLSGPDVGATEKRTQ